jgi:hypothetical protein
MFKKYIRMNKQSKNSKLLQVLNKNEQLGRRFEINGPTQQPSSNLNVRI